MQSQFIWKFFLQTGMPELYILFKERKRVETASRLEPTA